MRLETMRDSGAGGSLGASRPVVWAIKNVIAPIHRWIYRRTGGRAAGRNILLLTTRGRKTGKSHTNPVFFLRDSSSFVVCNVRPHSERTNPWVLNLRANPTATVQVGADIITCDAHELRGPQIDRYWPRLVALWPAYREHYERSGDRAIFVLEPRS
jgi:deazaflavin-dependent oxidoreductase (nitroreductase family)